MLGMARFNMRYVMAAVGAVVGSFLIIFQIDGKNRDLRADEGRLVHVTNAESLGSFSVVSKTFTTPPANSKMTEACARLTERMGKITFESGPIRSAPPSEACNPTPVVGHPVDQGGAPNPLDWPQCNYNSHALQNFAKSVTVSNSVPPLQLAWVCLVGAEAASAQSVFRVNATLHNAQVTDKNGRLWTGDLVLEGKGTSDGDSASPSGAKTRVSYEVKGVSGQLVGARGTMRTIGNTFALTVPVTNPNGTVTNESVSPSFNTYSAEIYLGGAEHREHGHD